MIIQDKISQLNTMYPSFSLMLDPASAKTNVWPEYAKWSSIYGFSFGNSAITINGATHNLTKGQYFSFFVESDAPLFEVNDKLFVVCRLGYKCQNTTGWVEEQGRLSYIDGCSDSLLVYPPRMGDPSLNLLYFPPGIEQTAHLHPSVRLGCVISGRGRSDVWANGRLIKQDLESGKSFCLQENELHRFVTTDSHMTVIAWHPDGDWGPTDHNHTMLNRTYLKK